MLTGTGLGDDALCAQALRQQCLPDRIVDLVCARMREILTLQPYLRAPAPSELVGVRERRRPPGPGAQFLTECLLELGCMQVPPHARVQSLERRHESFGHIAASKRTEASMHIRSSTHPAIELRSCRAFIRCAFHVVLVQCLGRLRCALR